MIDYFVAQYFHVFDFVYRGFHKAVSGVDDELLFFTGMDLLYRPFHFQAEAEIVINQNDSHDEIADKLVEGNIYPHKNDIMLILEILEYDKLEAEKYLVDYGIVPKHTNALKLYDEKSLRIREVLAKEQVIVDEDAFEKFQYMNDRSTKIKPGTKSFKVNSSLREIVDVLSN